MSLVVEGGVWGQLVETKQEKKHNYEMITLPLDNYLPPALKEKVLHMFNEEENKWPLLEWNSPNVEVIFEQLLVWSGEASYDDPILMVVVGFVIYMFICHILCCM